MCSSSRWCKKSNTLSRNIIDGIRLETVAQVYAWPNCEVVELLLITWLDPHLIKLLISRVSGERRRGPSSSTLYSALGVCCQSLEHWRCYRESRGLSNSVDANYIRDELVTQVNEVVVVLVKETVRSTLGDGDVSYESGQWGGIGYCAGAIGPMTRVVLLEVWRTVFCSNGYTAKDSSGSHQASPLPECCGRSCSCANGTCLSLYFSREICLCQWLHFDVGLVCSCGCFTLAESWLWLLKFLQTS
ncbi:hypothetical protein SDJN03_18148, partial [Cucurbita argyrosperma subsp. sororia]